MGRSTMRLLLVVLLSSLVVGQEEAVSLSGGNEASFDREHSEARDHMGADHVVSRRGAADNIDYGNEIEETKALVQETMNQYSKVVDDEKKVNVDAQKVMT